MTSYLTVDVRRSVEALGQFFVMKGLRELGSRCAAAFDQETDKGAKQTEKLK